MKKKTLAIGILCVLVISAIYLPIDKNVTATGEEPPSEITVECHNTSRNNTGLERYRHTIIVAQISGTTALEGWTIYLNITGAVTIHSTAVTNSDGVCMWEWIPENLSSVTITAEYNGTVTTNIVRWIYSECDVILELEHAQKYGLNNRLYMQLFSVSKVSYFEPSGAPYRIQIVKHNGVDNHTVITEWVGFLDNHGFKAFYIDLDDTNYTTVDYEIWVYIYNNTGNESEGDTLVDSDGGTTLGRGSQFEAGNYLSFLDVYGPSSSLWWYEDLDDPANDLYDVATDNTEPLNWTHTIYGTIALVGEALVSPCPDKLSSANNYKNFYFNDTNGNEVWDNDTGSEDESEDIWLDNGNGIWDGNESQEGYPYEEYNGTPFLKMFHTFKIVPGAGVINSTTISADTWTWMGYINGSSKTGATLYSEISHCEYLCMYDPSSNYYYTYGPGLEESFNVTYGSAVAVLAWAESSWDHK